MRTIIFTYDYAASARNVWQIAIDYDCLTLEYAIIKAVIPAKRSISA